MIVLIIITIIGGDIISIQKFSRQRESIKEYLASTKEHPTADTVYMNIKKIYPNVSLGTVYRNLNQLEEQGEILKLSYGTSDRFDGNPEPHVHFICSTCSSVSDLEIDAKSLEHVNDMASAGFNGRIQGHSIHFFGICPHCNSTPTDTISTET